MRIRVIHDLDDLADDLRAIPVKARVGFMRAVRTNTERGNRAAQDVARSRSGPHGRLYYKRITSEMIGPLEGEYGPTGDVVGNAVGAGWRHGPGNTDLEASLDLIRGKFYSDIDDVIDRVFW